MQRQVICRYPIRKPIQQLLYLSVNRTNNQTFRNISSTMSDKSTSTIPSSSPDIDGHDYIHPKTKSGKVPMNAPTGAAEAEQSADQSNKQSSNQSKHQHQAPQAKEPGQEVVDKDAPWAE